MEEVREALDWIMNVWDELGEDVTQSDIVYDFTHILGDEAKAEAFVEAWFEDHGRLLNETTFLTYETEVTLWIEKTLDNINKVCEGV
jgi:hypothetical protein